MPTEYTAGFADEIGSSAMFFDPRKLLLDKHTGLVFVSSGTRIRQINITETTSGGLADVELRVGTIAGTSMKGTEWVPQWPAGENATFKFPNGMALDQDGNIYVVDTDARNIRFLERFEDFLFFNFSRFFFLERFKITPTIVLINFQTLVPKFQTLGPKPQRTQNRGLYKPKSLNPKPHALDPRP